MLQLRIPWLSLRGKQIQLKADVRDVCLSNRFSFEINEN